MRPTYPLLPPGLPPRMFGAAMIVSIAIGLAVFILSIIIWWKIFAKAGYSGALGLLMFVPIANIIVLLILAFGRWPIEEELDRLRGRMYR